MDAKSGDARQKRPAPGALLCDLDDRVMMASEMGVLPVAEEKIIEKWRLQPGKMLLIDLEAGRIISDDEIKASLSTAHPYEEWLARAQIKLEDLPAPEGETHVSSSLTVLDQQKAFGYTQEDLKFLLAPMVANGEEGTGSMGTDTPISALSEKSKPLYTYFKQKFAQVTNPPNDTIREELVKSLVSFIGPRPNLLDLEGTSGLKRLEWPNPFSAMMIWRKSGASATLKTMTSMPSRST